jgi:hypothetical protein
LGNRYVLANSFKEKLVDPKQYPRIILIAEDFSDDIRNLTNLVIPDIELYRYKVVQHNSEEGIIFMSTSKPMTEENEISEPPKIENILEYVKNKTLLQLIENLRGIISSLNPQVEEYPTHSYIGYKYKGLGIGFIKTQRQSFDLGSTILDEDGLIVTYTSQRISQLNDDYSETIKNITNSYETLHKLKG